MMKLNRIRLLTGRITLETGLHIGAGNDELRIGGIDNPVLKHPVSDEPYIPGSSLKGKMRHLMEWRCGLSDRRGVGIADWQRAAGADRARALSILRLFGTAPTEQMEEDHARQIGPSRLGFWDAPLSADWARMTRERDARLTEAKMENVINRITGAAENPRQTERVPAGAAFEFRLSVREFEGDDDAMFVEALAGLKLLELDGIGGSGSRGYGKIRFESLAIDGEPVRLPTDPFAA